MFLLERHRDWFGVNHADENGLGFYQRDSKRAMKHSWAAASMGWRKNQIGNFKTGWIRMMSSGRSLRRAAKFDFDTARSYFAASWWPLCSLLSSLAVRKVVWLGFSYSMHWQDCCWSTQAKQGKNFRTAPPLHRSLLVFLVFTYVCYKAIKFCGRSGRRL